MLCNTAPFRLPNSLFKALLEQAGIPDDLRLADLSRKQLLALRDSLHRMPFQIDGQTTNKEEFVTAGGVSLDEVNFKTMESKLVPGLFFAGEVLDIDGVTGGFNFQNAWTTGWIAGSSL
jgi:predicted Rossmann fold flavoprotein